MRTASILLMLLILAGCGSSSEVSDHRQGEIEYLNVENERLQREIISLEQEKRTFEQRIQNLERDLSSVQTEPTPPAEPTVIERPVPAKSGVTVDVLSNDTHFIPGTARLNAAGIEYMKAVATTLKQQYPTGRIRVEGYTENKPLSDRQKAIFPSNWELSAARAAMVVRHLQWTHKMDASRFEVVGFGHYSPMASDRSGTDQELNRSVRIVVLTE